MRTFVLVLIYGGFGSLILGTLALIVAVIHGKITGRPPAGLIGDERPMDLVVIIGGGLGLIGFMLGLIGIGLALMFVVPNLRELVQLVFPCLEL